MDNVQDDPASAQDLSDGDYDTEAVLAAFGSSRLKVGCLVDEESDLSDLCLSPGAWRVGKRKRAKCDDGMQYPDVPYEPKVISKPVPSLPVMDNINVRLVVASLGGSDHGLNVAAVSRLREKTREMTMAESDKVKSGVPVGNYVYVKVLRDVTTKAEFTELMESLHVDFGAGGYRHYLPRHTFGNLTYKKTLGGGLKVGKAGSRPFFSLEV